MTIFWLRRDLRLEDNAGLYHALKSGNPVVPIFIFDTEILDGLNDRSDKRVGFIHSTIIQMQEQLLHLGTTLHVLQGTPIQCFETLIATYNITAVYTNNDYEPYARERDESITALLKDHNIAFHSYKDQVIFERDEIMKANGEPYTVFTPYSKKWKVKLNQFFMKPYPTNRYFNNFYKQAALPILSLKEIGFEEIEAGKVVPELDKCIAENYDKTRNYPGINGTTKLSIHLRFGTISIRQFAREARQLNETLLNELIWRDFYQMILWHYPHVINNAFKKEYDAIQWRNNEKEFDLWCKGMTGYPIVDAGMRELNTTGYMHNRVRMVVASFLTKHLLIDWRWGEAYFAEKLLDYDLAANNGGWQWAAGSGCDAAPYFRIFNPYLQTEKFDPDLIYIRKWIPELETFDYPQPIVQHEDARKRCLQVYKVALQK